jgi:hypothetical protein
LISLFQPFRNWRFQSAPTQPRDARTVGRRHRRFDLTLDLLEDPPHSLRVATKIMFAIARCRAHVDPSIVRVTVDANDDVVRKPDHQRAVDDLDPPWLAKAALWRLLADWLELHRLGTQCSEH